MLDDWHGARGETIKLRLESVKNSATQLREGIRAVKSWGERHAAQSSIDVESFQMEVKAKNRYFTLQQQFRVRIDGRLLNVSKISSQATGFLGWLPYAPVQWALSTDKLLFKARMIEHGLRTPAWWIAPQQPDRDYIVKGSRGSFPCLPGADSGRGAGQWGHCLARFPLWARIRVSPYDGGRGQRLASLVRSASCASEAGGRGARWRSGGQIFGADPLLAGWRGRLLRQRMVARSQFEPDPAAVGLSPRLLDLVRDASRFMNFSRADMAFHPLRSPASFWRRTSSLPIRRALV